MSDASPAIFLSYAREDAAAARRIAEALRAAGLEVWFDENELRGGDQWDAKIRRQIDACALFIPIVSQHTQSRGKGYFRLEWKLAVEQTHLMAEGIAYLAPVVIDDTREGGALVPPEFLKVQWTRLPGALPTPAFVEQVKRLLDGPAAAGSPRSPGAGSAGSGLPAVASAKAGDPALQGHGRSRGLLALAAVAAVAVAVAGYFALRPGPKPETAAPAAPPPAPVAVLPAPAKPAAPAVSEKSVAVLPFENRSDDKENAFFTDGMHDDLITALAKVRDLKVISRTSVLAYRDPAARNLRRIAADLGVAYVLEGGVQRAGNRVRINLQLIDARTDAHVWAETYNRELNDIFAIQAELVQQVTGALKATLTAGEQDLLARRPTESQVAYDLHLRARLMAQALGLGASRRDYEAVIAVFEQAAAADPKFALPHVQMSILHGTMYWFGNLDATPERRTRVLASLETAMRLAPDAPETHLARGSYEYTCRNDWAQALVEYRKAEAGLPNDAQLIYRMGIAHRRAGQHAEAQRAFEAAIRLNPSDLNVVITYFEALLDVRQYRRVVDEVDRFANLFPTERRLLATRVVARFALTGARTAFLQEMAALPLGSNDPHGLAARFGEAMRVGDLATAERLLEDPRMPPLAEGLGVVNAPVALTRARVAWLQGRQEDARRFADEAVADLRARTLTPRQEPIALFLTAFAHAFAGRHEEARRGARQALVEQRARDVYAAETMDDGHGQLLVVCGRRDEALEVLRSLLNGARVPAPDAIRFNQVWSRLQDDPRFEEILRAANFR
jgi:TolB-like protein